MAPPAGARCAKHADTAAVDVCQRCGTFVCGECAQIRQEDVFCADCARILDRPAPARSKVAFGLAAAPLPVGFAVAIFLPVVVAVAVFVALTATSLALMLHAHAVRRLAPSPMADGFHRWTWALLAVDLGGALFAALFFAH